MTSDEVDRFMAKLGSTWKYEIIPQDEAALWRQVLVGRPFARSCEAMTRLVAQGLQHRPSVPQFIAFANGRVPKLSAWDIPEPDPVGPPADSQAMHRGLASARSALRPELPA